MDPVALEHQLRKAWSLRTSSRWNADNPARGQCSVTAICVHQMHGGEILKTDVAGGVHFYNRIDGRRLDFTVSQFSEQPDYSDTPSSVVEALTDCRPEQVAVLAQALDLTSK